MSPRTHATAQPAAAEPTGTRRAAPRLLSPLVAWLGMVELAGLIIWRGAMQPRGMLDLMLDGKLTIWYGQRLWPLAALTTCAIGCALAVRASRAATRFGPLPAFLATHRRAVAGLLIGLGLAGAMAAVWALRAFPNSSDEYDYLFEARTFLASRLWNPAPPLPDLFAFFGQSVYHGKWFGTYPPGWPLLLAAAMRLRLPAWLADPLLGGLLLVVLWKLAQRRDGALGGVVALALTALTPFFFFIAACYF